MEDGDDLVDRVAIERQARVLRLGEDLGQPVERVRHPAADHVDPRRHHAARLGVAEIDDSPDQVAILRFEDPLLRPDLDERLDLLLRRLVVVGPVVEQVARRAAGEDPSSAISGQKTK